MSQSITNMQQVWLSNTTFYNAISMSVSTMGYGANANSSLLKLNVDGNTKISVDASGNMITFGTIGSSSSWAMKNRVINGDMKIDQRFAGNANNITAAYSFYPDRWVVTTSTTPSGTLTTQRIATSIPGGPQYCLRLSRSAGTYTGYLISAQVIETSNCYDLAGKPVTLSFKVRAGSGYTGTNLIAYVITGTGVDEGVTKALVQTYTGWAAATTTVTPSTSFQTFSFSSVLGSSVSEVCVAFATGSFTGTGSATDYIDITDIQLEVGTVATAFERRLAGQELTLCQRYFCKNAGPDVPVPANGAAYTLSSMSSGSSGSYATTTAYLPWISFPTTMRVPPQMTFINCNLNGAPTAGVWSYYYTSGWLNFSTMTLQSLTTSGFGALGTGTFPAWGSILYYGAWTANAELT